MKISSIFHSGYNLDREGYYNWGGWDHDYDHDYYRWHGWYHRWYYYRNGCCC